MKLWISLCFALFASVFSLAAQDTMQISVKNFHISIPVGWMAQYTDNSQVFFLYSPEEEGDDFRENVNLTVETLSKKTTLANYMKASIDSLKGVYKNFKLVDSRENYLVVTGKVNSTPVKQLFYLYVNNKEAYVLTFSSNEANYSRFEEEFQSIADSFSYD